MKNEEDMKNEIKEGSIKELKPLEDNPMKHGKKNRETTQKSIKEVGVNRGVSAHKNDDGTMTILAGHGTIDACREAGYENAIFVPVDGKTLVVSVREGMTQEEQYRYAMYDNAAAKQAHFDAEALANIRYKKGIDTAGVFTESEFESLVKLRTDKKDVQPAEDQGGPSVGEQGFFIIVECEDKTHQEMLAESLEEEGYSVVKYSGNKRGQE